MSTAPTESDEIRRQMALIRLDMHRDVRGVVATAEKVADWSRYLGRYPLVSLGVAFAVGYLIVPRKKKHTLTLDELKHQLGPKLDAKIQAVSGSTPTEKAREKKSGLIGAAFGMLAPLALRAAQGYALKYVEQWIAQQQSLHAGPPQSGPGAGPTSTTTSGRHPGGATPPRPFG